MSASIPPSLLSPAYVRAQTIVSEMDKFRPFMFKYKFKSIDYKFLKNNHYCFLCAYTRKKWLLASLAVFFCNLGKEICQGTLSYVTHGLQRKKSALTVLLISLPLGRYNWRSQATTSSYTSDYYSTTVLLAN